MTQEPYNKANSSRFLSICFEVSRLFFANIALIHQLQRLKLLVLASKFIYSEKANKFTLLLSYVVPVKSKGKISQKFVAFSEYMNCKTNQNLAVPRGQTKTLIKILNAITPSPWLARIHFTRISLTHIFKKFPFLT